MAKEKKTKQPIFQNHHVIYENKEKRVKPVIRKVRKGVHQAVSLLRRFTFLTDQEIDTVKTECELKRKYNGN